jgi:lipopolysaccharide transport system ATP-binding protein
MSEVSVQLDQVSKKFKKGEMFDSLRDLIPALARSLSRRRAQGQLEAREFWALKDVSFEVKRGEAFAIIGSNGAGKSTMLKLLSRIMKPTSGRITVHGRLSALIEVAAGFHPDLTGRENIYLNGTILGMTRPEIDARLDEIVAFAGLEEFIDTPVKRYSSGMYARLGFSVAAHVNPEVLIVDEVLSVGDYVFQQKCIARMREVITSGATVLFVSHNLKAVSELCDRAVLLERGRAISVGSADDVIRQYMTRLSDGRDIPVDKPVYVSRVCVRDRTGEAVRFESGDTAWVDIEVVATRPTEKVAVVLWVMDETHHVVFSTSTERLGRSSVSLRTGDRYRCTFQLRMNAANSSLFLGVGLFRYDIDKEFDRVAPAATLYVTADSGVRGSLNCFPEVLREEIVDAIGAATRDQSPTAVGA